MKVSLNIIKQLIDIDLPPIEELVEKINRQLGTVDEVLDLGEKYKDAMIVKVATCEKHPNADRLSVCMIDTGADEPVQVVCGAPNVHTDMWTVWLPPESIVPSTYRTTDEFKLGARELRGVMSHGMLAAPDELAIGSGHDGIVELKDKDLPDGQKLQAGSSFAKVFALDDTVLDIENKMFTHRPDLFGQLGVAREISVILGHSFDSPSWYKEDPGISNENIAATINVFEDTGGSVPRLLFAVVDDIEVTPSPMWLQCKLVAMGSKPINNIVDITNYVMLMTSQPTHAYDLAKIQGGSIGARMAKRNEKIRLLNGKEYTLDEADIVIADGNDPVGLAGVMGGEHSQVSGETKGIVLEVGTFDMYAIRRTSMRHGLFTDAVTRFNKGQSLMQNDHVISWLIDCMKAVSGSAVVSQVSDTNSNVTEHYWGESWLHKDVPTRVSHNFINRRLGLDLSDADQAELLEKAEIMVEKDGSDLVIRAPFWRTDIAIAEDVVEEIGRLYGYDKLPRILPDRTSAPVAQNSIRIKKQQIRELLQRGGANEVLSYSFVHGKIMKGAGQDLQYAFKITNALSPDLQYYRTALMPCLLNKMHANHKAGYEKMALYEIGKTHFVGEMDEVDPSVPNEDVHVALIYSSKQSSDSGAPYFDARNYLTQLGLEDDLVPMIDFDVSSDEWGQQLVSAYEPSRSALIIRENQIWGVVGEFKSDVRRHFKLPAHCAGFEIHLDAISLFPSVYRPLNKFPAVTQDLTMRVPISVTYDSYFTLIQESIHNNISKTMHVDITPVSIYIANLDDDHKSISLRLRITDSEKTLTDAEIVKILDEASKVATRDLQAVRA